MPRKPRIEYPGAIYPVRENRMRCQVVKIFGDIWFAGLIPIGTGVISSGVNHVITRGDQRQKIFKDILQRQRISLEWDRRDTTSTLIIQYRDAGNDAWARNKKRRR